MIIADMTGIRTSPWPARITAFLVAAACAASAAYWVLRWQPADAQQRAAAPAQAEVSVAALDSRQLALRLGGKAEASAPTASTSNASLQLIGVVAAGNGEGSAVIVVDGKPAKSFRVGSQVTENLILQSVQPRKAELAANASAPSQLTIELPAKPKSGS